MAEVQLRFINRYNDSWPAAIRAVEGNLISHEKLEQLITHRYRLEDAIKAMELVGGVTKKKEGEMMIKVQIVDDE
jgi:L-iditol 2-dehydrogenase